MQRAAKASPQMGGQGAQEKQEGGKEGGLGKDPLALRLVVVWGEKFHRFPTNENFTTGMQVCRVSCLIQGEWAGGQVPWPKTTAVLIHDALIHLTIQASQ